ncbi:MAG: helix-turn-helix transcriptional regulator [Butyricicoccus sp.]
MDYIDRLKTARKRKRLSQAALSQALGFSHATYGLYEARKNKMDVETFGEICRLLDVTPNQMLGFEPWEE